MQTKLPIDDSVFHTVNLTSIEKVDVLEITNKHCHAKLSLFGAHLISFIPNKDRRERLWLSETAVFDKSKAIRGGIPICWPWFADIYPQHQQRENKGQTLDSPSQYPAHGFVRTQDWKVTAIEESDSETKIILQASRLGMFGFEKSLSAEVEFTFAEKCTVKLRSKNLSSLPQTLTAALHSYFNVGDISVAAIKGIQGKYIDKLQGNLLCDSPSQYHIQEEVDRIHLTDENNPMETLRLSFKEATSSSIQEMELTQQGHDSVIVWNPWIEKSAKMADMQPEAYKNMLCIETAITSPYCLLPGDTHVLEQVIN